MEIIAVYKFLIRNEIRRRVAMKDKKNVITFVASKEIIMTINFNIMRNMMCIIYTEDVIV